MNRIYHPDLEPLSLPHDAPPIGADALLWRINEKRTIAQEVYQRANGTYGFRYLAWVNFEDAGGDPHYLWNEYLPSSNCTADALENVTVIAENHALECGVYFGEWIKSQTDQSI